jgi:SAM-dependent methyltransferase
VTSHCIPQLGPPPLGLALILTLKHQRTRVRADAVVQGRGPWADGRRRGAVGHLSASFVRACACAGRCGATAPRGAALRRRSPSVSCCHIYAGELSPCRPVRLTTPIWMTLCFVKLLVASVQVARNSSSFHDVSTSTSDAAWKAHIELQQSKLRQSDAMRLKIRAIDVGRQDQVARQFAQSAIDGIAGVRSFKGQSVICLGARLGGEVRAFKSLGALAVGVDLEPGPDNMDVLVGDFENLAFADASFTYAYSNVLDHLHDLSRFSAELCRVVRPNGFFFAALFSGKGDRWNGRQGVSADSYAPLVKALSPMFALVTTTSIKETMEVRKLARLIDHAQTSTVPLVPWHQVITTLYFRRAGLEGCRRTQERFS